MISDLLSELDKLSARNNELVRKVTAAKAVLQDTRSLEEAKGDTKRAEHLDSKLPSSVDEDILPDRKGRASSCIIPPSMQLRIGRGRSEDSTQSATSPVPGLIISSMCSRSTSPARLNGPSRQRAVTVPDLHKPLPPTPRTPQWQLKSRTAFAQFERTDFFYDSSHFFPGLDDEAALLLNNMTYEQEPTTQLPFVPGQSYTRLPRRKTDEEIHRLLPTISTVASPKPANMLAELPLQLNLAQITQVSDLPGQKTRPLISSSPSRRRRKRFEDYLPRSILTGSLVEKPKLERSRTLSPSRAPEPIFRSHERAKSTHDLLRKASKGVRFVDEA